MAKSLIPLLVLLLVIGCGKQGLDRMVTQDGQLIAGELTAIDGSAAHFGETAVPIPDGPARIRMRNGASVRGMVSSDGDILVIEGAAGTFEKPLSSVGCISWGAHAQSSVLVDVPAGWGWFNTHIEIESQDHLSLLAGGAAYGATGVSSPSGQPSFSSTRSVVPEATHGELVMRIGETSAPVPVGESWSGTTGASGELFLAVNVPGDTASGYYTVAVLVESGSPREPCAIFPAGTEDWGAE